MTGGEVKKIEVRFAHHHYYLACGTVVLRRVRALNLSLTALRCTITKVE